MAKFSEYMAASLIYKTRKLYKFHDPLTWEIGKKGSGYKLEIPAGYQADVSTPRLLERFFDPHDLNLLVPAAIHDRLLEEGFDKAFASSEFRRALRARGVRPFKAWIMFFATLIHTVLKRGN